MQAQLYCTAVQVMDDIKMRGFQDPSSLMERVKAASEAVQKIRGCFIPVTDSRKFGAKVGREGYPLDVDPILAVTSITNDGTVVTTYALKSNGKYRRLWENGPYTQIEQENSWANDDGVVIPGRYGLYEDTASLGFTASLDIGATSLAIANGSLLSPGCVLKIEDEQFSVTEGLGSKQSPAGTAASSLVNGAIAAASDEITVDNGAEFFQGEVIQIGVEDLKIIKINGNVLAVERGWNRTIAVLHADDSAIKVYRTFTLVRGVNGTTAAVHTTKAVSQMVVPETVNYLTRQIAALMRMKAESGFSGVTGSPDGGQGRYYSEFPPNQIADVLDAYKIWRF